MAPRSQKFQGPFLADWTGVIQVVSRAFDVLHCFTSPTIRLGNGDISSRCGLPPSTVSRLTLTLTRIGQLEYLPQEQKYCIGPNAIAMGASLIVRQEAHQPHEGVQPIDGRGNRNDTAKCRTMDRKRISLTSKCNRELESLDRATACRGQPSDEDL